MAGPLTMNPWKKIWLAPQAAIRAIINFNPKHHLIWLSVIYGLPMALNFAQSSSLIQALPLWTILVAAIVVSPFIGILAITLCSLLLLWTGRWIGGNGRFDTVRAAVAWSNVPNLVSIALWGVLVAVFGAPIFMANFPEMVFVGYQAGVLFLVFLIEAIASIWGFVLLLKTLSEVQGFSVWKALLNVAIPLAIIIAGMWIVDWIILGIKA